jgi:hypothetical protein
MLAVKSQPPELSVDPTDNLEDFFHDETAQ